MKRSTPSPSRGLVEIIDASVVLPVREPLEAVLLASSLPAGMDELASLTERWLLTLAPTTAQGYRLRISRWFEYCGRHGVAPLQATPELVADYRQWVEDSDTAYSSARNELAVVRSFYRFVVDDRGMSTSPAAGTTRPVPANLRPLDFDPRTVSAQRAAQGWLTGFRGTTRMSYESNLRHLFTWCFSLDLDPLQLTRTHLDAYQRVLEGVGLKPNSIAQRLITVRGFYRYCLEEEVIAADPARRIKPPKLPSVSASRGIDRNEIALLLREAKSRSPQLLAIVSLLIFNGLRISEAMGADVEDLTRRRGHRVLMVERKGYAGTKQPQPLSPRTAAALDAWLAVRDARLRPENRPIEPTGPLFLNERGERMSRQSFWALLRTMAKSALPHRARDIHPHDLRHGFVTMALDAGVPLRDVQDSAGHASADTTRRYDRNRNSLDRHATYTLTAWLSTDDDWRDNDQEGELGDASATS